jgi:xanthine dehydrogenase YagS FAD-binding subunit
MRPFTYERAKDVENAIRMFGPQQRDVPATQYPAAFLAGGTTLIDLMKLDVMQPQRIVDIGPLSQELSAIEARPDGLRLGALARMSDVADHVAIKRDFPVIAQSLALAASQQIRNMASLGGNVLQRTRCSYFRDVSYSNCNKRIPGSGCAALEGQNRRHAVLGGSEQCIAAYPGDFAQALIALDAQAEIAGPNGRRSLAFAELHREPGNTPHVETTLAPGELITAFNIRSSPWPRSLYLKIRDRESYEFALASAAIALDVANGTVKDARIALGGVATRPWRAAAAEDAIRGRELDDDTLKAAAEQAFAHARPHKHNAFKIELGKRTLMRGLHQAATMEI